MIIIHVTWRSLVAGRRIMDYVEYRLDVPETAPEKYTKIAEMVEKRYNLHARKLTKKDIFEGGYGKKLFDLINVTYSHLYGFSELSERQIDQYVKMYFPLPTSI